MPVFSEYMTVSRILTVEEIKMPLNSSKPTATISFAGLMLFLINPENKECQVAIVQCPNHELLVDILKITIDDNGSPLKSERISHTLDRECNIRITAQQALHAGVTERQGVEFSRENDVGDPNDSRWLVDVDGDKFGNQKLRLSPHKYVEPERRKSLGPYIIV